MAIQTFTAGQVLTATQVNNLQANDYNQTVNNKTDSYTLVVGDRGTRVVMNKSTATTITVNTSIFSAGDTVWIHNIGAGICTITAGTATVACSGSLALLQNQGGTLYFTSASAAIFFPSQQPGLTLLNTTSFSGVVSQRINPFSATYDNYRIIVQLTSSAGAGDIEMRLCSGSTPLTSSNYSFAYMLKQLGGAAFSSVGYGYTNTVWLVGGAQNSSTTGDLITIEVGNPFKTAYTTYHASATRHDDYVWTIGGKVNVNTSYDGFLIQNSGSHNIAGTISVYGYNK